MVSPLDHLIQAINAHRNFGSLANHYLEVNPELYSALIEHAEIFDGTDGGLPIFDQLNASYIPLTFIFTIQSDAVEYWQCVSMVDGMVTPYPECTETHREVTRNVT
jgi:hypothetical protein